MRLGMKALFQCRSKAGLAETRLAGDQHDLTVARFGTHPATQQNIEFLSAADKRTKRRAAQRLEPARNGTLSQHLPNAYRLSAARRVNRVEIATIKQVADQAPSARLDCYNVRLRG